MTRKEDVAASPSIARRKADASPLGFAALRRKGLAMVQALSGDLWTDFNLHDPGVTLLEVLCFALTEAVYGAESAVADVLTGPGGVIDFDRHALHLAPEILPTRPVTQEDYQRSVMDRLPDVERLTMTMDQPAAQGPQGLWRMKLALPAGRDSDEGRRKGQVESARAYLSQRNLCEDLATLPSVLAMRSCRLNVSITVEGARDPVDIVKEIFSVTRTYIAHEAPRTGLLQHLEEAQRKGLSLAESLEGPVNRHGWIPSESLEGSEHERLFFGDLARQLQAIEGVAEVRSLSLDGDGVDAEGGSVPWGGPDWALQLGWPETAEDLRGIQIHRSAAPVTLPRELLLRALRDLGRVSRAPHPDKNDLASGPNHPLAPPAGQCLAEVPFLPLRENLPPLYRHAQPDDARAIRPRETSHLTAYLTLFDQWLAHSHAQRSHLRDLFSVDEQPAQSYWWQMLGDPHIPRLSKLYLDSPEAIQAAAFEPVDGVLERRGRILDYLLALHGESAPQMRVRAFGVYYDSASWTRRLFEQKRLLLERIVRHSRDRMAAFDYSRPSFGTPDNTPVVEEKVSILVGFKHHHRRSLTDTFRSWGLSLAGADDAASGWLGPQEVRADWRQLRPVQGGWLPQGQDPDRARLDELARHVRVLSAGRLPPALWRCAVHAERYWQAPGPWGAALLLGPDERGHWWKLAEIVERPGDNANAGVSVESLADEFRSLLCHLHLESEGMHLVEHVLLRPDESEENSDDAPRDDAAAFWPHRMTAVFSGWTARGADTDFRRFAEEMLAANLPAHLQVDCLWFELDELETFEHAYQRWLDDKRAHCLANPPTGELKTALDDSARALRRLLLRPERHPGEPTT